MPKDKPLKNTNLKNLEEVTAFMTSFGMPSSEQMAWQMQQYLVIQFYDSKRLIKKKIQKYLKNPHEVIWIREPIRIGRTDHTISVQAGSAHYCFPKDNKGVYTHIEAGMPTFKLSKSFNEQYRQSSNIYPYVPLSDLYKELAISVRKLKTRK